MFEYFVGMLRKDWQGMVVIAASAVLIAFIPVIAGYATPENRHFYPVSLGSPADTSTYLAWIEQSKQNHIAGISLYNSDQQERVFFHPLFFIGGQLAKLLNWSNLTVYLLLRAAGVVFMVAMAFLFFSKVFPERRSVIIATILLVFGTSLNPLIFLYSPESWSAEWNIFLSLSHTMLNNFSLGLMLGMFSWFAFFRSQSWRHLIGLGVMSSGLALVHPYYLISVFMILGVWSVYEFVRRRDYYFFRKYVWVLLLTMPSVVLVAYELYANPILGIWAFMQSNVPARFTWAYLSGYLIILIFLAVSIVPLKQRPLRGKIFLLTWLLVNLGLVLLPGERFDRKILQGMQVPIVVFVVVGLNWLLESDNPKINKYQTAIIAATLALFIVPNAKLLWKDAQYYMTTTEMPYRQSLEFKDGIKWLQNNASETDVILSSYQSSNLIPGLVGIPVYQGHYDQTVNATTKAVIASKVLSSSSGYKDPMPRFLKSERISLIFADSEIIANGGISTINRPYLSKAYENDEIQIYQIDHNLLP